MRFRLALILLLMVGCAVAAEDVPFTPLTPLPADKATVYIYRPDAEFNSAGYPRIFINGEKKFDLENGHYGALTLPPGEYEIKAQGSRWGTNWWPGPTTRTITIKAGHEYYVRVIPALPSGVKAGPHLFFEKKVAHTLMTLVPKEQALREITETKLAE
jgi:hypothetical protein